VVAWSAGGITRQRRESDRPTGPTTGPGIAPGEPAPDDERRLQRRDAVVHRLALERVARAKRA